MTYLALLFFVLSGFFLAAMVVSRRRLQRLLAKMDDAVEGEKAYTQTGHSSKTVTMSYGDLGSVSAFEESFDLSNGYALDRVEAPVTTEVPKVKATRKKGTTVTKRKKKK